MLATAATLCLTLACGNDAPPPESQTARADTTAAAPAPQAPPTEAPKAAEPSTQPPPPATPKPTGPSAEQDAATLTDSSLDDSARLAAAERLLSTDRSQLVQAYSDRASVPIVRRLIDARFAARDTTVLPLILDLFRTRGGEERIDFEVYLIGYGQAAEDELIGLLGSDDVSLVLRTLDTLAKMKSVAAADTVASLLRHADAWVRIGAAHAIGEIAAPGATAHLIAALDDTAHAVVNASLVALGRLRAPELFEPAMALTASDNLHLRKHAAMALGELGDGRARATLQRLTDEDPDPGVRFMANKALKRLSE